MMKKLLSFTLAALLLPCSVFVQPASAAEDDCNAILNEMTTQQKVEQMIMPTFRYWSEDGSNVGLTQMNDTVADFVSDHGFSGVILFAQNSETTEQTARLVDAFRQANANGGHPDLLISIDQEGGSVSRLNTGTQLCGNMALAANGREQDAFSAGEIIGTELSALGINNDLAPVVDVNDNPRNPEIGVRSFSDDAQIVSKFGVPFMQGIQSQGVVATLKHFPGHGNTAIDSHTGLDSVSKTYDELLQNELVPFKACIDAGAEMIMTAHIQFPNIETRTYISKQDGLPVYLPATLSRTMITDILRNDLGFDGVVITDALEMGAITNHFYRLDAARLAINAGADILLMPLQTSTPEGLADMENYISSIVEMVENGEIAESEIDDSVLRILRLKDKHGLLDRYDSSDIEERIESADKVVGSQEHHDREWEITKRSITIVKDDQQLLPLTTEGKKTVILAAYSNEVMSVNYAIGRLKDEGKIGENDDITVAYYSDMSTYDLYEITKDADQVIALTELYGYADLDPNNAEGIMSVHVDHIIEDVHANGGKFIMISCQLPYDAARYPDADAIMLAWSACGMSEDPRITDGDLTQYGPNIPAAVYLAFSDDEYPQGKLPVNIYTINEYYGYNDEILYPRGYGLELENAEYYGDVDGDGTVTSADALLVLRVSTGSEETPDNAGRLGDVDKDGAVDSSDALIILRFSVDLPVTGKVGKIYR